MEKKKTYSMSCDFEIIIRGKYSDERCSEVELDKMCPDVIWCYVAENISHFCRDAEIDIFNERIKEE